MLSAPLKKKLTAKNLLYGAVWWINGNPILDGMPYFKTKEACVKFIAGTGISAQYTIIRLERFDELYYGSTED